MAKMHVETMTIKVGGKLSGSAAAGEWDDSAKTLTVPKIKWSAELPEMGIKYKVESADKKFNKELKLNAWDDNGKAVFKG